MLVMKLSDILPVCLRDLNLASILLRFLLAICFGAVIGIERGKKHHAAGMRTHIVVCIGAASVMMVSQYISSVMNVQSDMSRLGAQVISGIGFLGVGTIVTSGKKVRGLTTAAGLWASACMGLAIGIGFYEGAAIMCVFLYLVISCLNMMDEKYLKRGSNIQLYIEYSPGTKFSLILKMLRSLNWHTTSVEPIDGGGKTCTMMLLSIAHSGKGADRQALFESLREIEGVLCVELL